jgi:hypothetical protein
MTAKGTARYANDFLSASLILQPRPDNVGARFRSDLEISIPVYYMLCHVIELSLKAILIHEGRTEDELAGRGKHRGKFGHDLLQLFEAAQGFGSFAGRFESMPQDRKVLEVLTPLFLGKEIEYFSRGYTEYPKHSYLLDLASRLSACASEITN